MLATILAASMMAQHFRESKHNAPHDYSHITGPSDAVRARRAKQRAALHEAAEQSRRDLDQALMLLRKPPTLYCPCAQPGRNAFE